MIGETILLPRPGSATKAQALCLGPGSVIAAARDLVGSLLSLSQRPEWLPRAHQKLTELGSLGDDWSSYGTRPSKRSVETARVVVEELARHGLKPVRIIPIADGGVSFRLAVDSKSARIEVDNDGETILITEISAEAEPHCETLSPRSAASSAARFLY